MKAFQQLALWIAMIMATIATSSLMGDSLGLRLAPRDPLAAMTPRGDEATPRERVSRRSCHYRSRR
jgi:hypothetical protein